MRARILTGVFLMAVSGVSQSEVFDQGGGMIYDDVLDVTWLLNWLVTFESAMIKRVELSGSNLGSTAGYGLDDMLVQQ